MWVFAKEGFVSIVKDPKIRGRLIVRARAQADINAFHELCIEAGGANPIHVDVGTDYKYRFTSPQYAVAKVMNHLAFSIDYLNFKEAAIPVENKDASTTRRCNAYMQIWAIMKDFQDVTGS